MQNNYTYGEIIYILKGEYDKYRYLFKELKKLIEIDDFTNYDFRSISLDNETADPLTLIVKKSLNPSKRIRKKSNSYYAQFNILNKNGYYEFSEVKSIIKEYRPNLNIVDWKTVNKYLDILLSSRLLNLSSIEEKIDDNHDLYLSYDYLRMKTPSSYISWNGAHNCIKYEQRKKDNSINEILSYQIPIEQIPDEWLELFQIYREKMNNQIDFILEGNNRKKGQLFVKSTSPNGVVKLLKK